MSIQMIPRSVIHLEAETDECTCPRLARCGGIEVWRGDCPEHGADSGPTARYHTHTQQVNQINRHRRIS